MPASTPSAAFWSAIDAEIEGYIATHEVSEGTRNGYDGKWKRWETFCAELGVPALGAPWEAYEAFWRACVTQSYFPNRRRKTEAGKPYALSSIDGVLAAIAWHHKQAGLVAAFHQPEHASLHSQFRSGFAREYASADVVSARPLRPDDVRTLNRQEPPRNDGRDRLVAALLLSLDASWAWDRVRLANGTHIEEFSEAGLDLTDPLMGGTVRIPCSCGVPQPDGPLAALPAVCGACIIGEQLSVIPAGECLLTPPGKQSGVTRWKDGLRRVSRTFLHLSVTPGGYLTYDGPADAWSVLGTRLALFESEREGLPYRSAQARMSVSWPIGLRSDDEPSRMSRRHVSVRGDGSLEVELPKAKTDQAGVGSSFHIPGRPKPTNVVGRVIQWLAIIDAFTGMGPDGPLFPAFGPSDGSRRPRSKGTRQTDFRKLQQVAGLSGFTLHSTRTGFATTGIEQGYTESDLQEAMRLTQPRDLIRYARAAHTNTGAPAEQLIRRLMEAE